NLADPAQLNQAIDPGFVPGSLPCRLLFTTRRRDLGRFRSVDVTVLPEETALQLLLRQQNRRPALAPDHPEREDALAICRMLLLRVAGQLPEAAAFPIDTRGLRGQVSPSGRPGSPSPLARALKRLHNASLVEELRQGRMRLHPLVREFALGQTPEEEAAAFRR